MQIITIFIIIHFQVSIPVDKHVSVHGKQTTWRGAFKIYKSERMTPLYVIKDVQYNLIAAVDADPDGFS
jgi:hypothetical protein